MKDFHGIIFAYNTFPELRELVKSRTAASLPFCGRYRLIDFPLSSMRNAGILDVGVIVQRDYQSLLDHIGSGKPWDMSRRDNGLRMLPPFGLPEYHKGNYTGTMEALNAVSTYIKDIKSKYVVLMLGNLYANIDLTVPMKQHKRSGAEITAICADRCVDGSRLRYVTGDDGFVKHMLIKPRDESKGVASLEAYIINRDVLLRLMDYSHEHNLYRFHKDAIDYYLANGGKMGIYIHHGYSAIIHSVDSYYHANMDMLDAANRGDIFPADRPVRTKIREEVSTYYGEHSSSLNCLVADNCIIEGDIENCIVFSGARISAGAKLKDCIIMRRCTVGENSELHHVIADKAVVFSAGTVLTGSDKLPIVVPKGIEICLRCRRTIRPQHRLRPQAIMPSLNSL